MFVVGKCPKCEKVAHNPQIENVIIGNKSMGPAYAGINITCQHCHTILGSAIDPAEQEKHIVDELLDALGVPAHKRKRR